MTVMLKPSDLPAPETLIDYGGGTFGPFMFHFADEDDSAADIAKDQGFEYYWIEFNDVVPDEHSLSIAYANGADPADILPHWTPPEPKPGFFLAGKNDSENGPVAHYLKKNN